MNNMPVAMALSKILMEDARRRTHGYDATVRRSIQHTTRRRRPWKR
jgi:hypothetical protein